MESFSLAYVSSKVLFTWVVSSFGTGRLIGESCRFMSASSLVVTPTGSTFGAKTWLNSFDIFLAKDIWQNSFYR